VRGVALKLAGILLSEEAKIAQRDDDRRSGPQQYAVHMKAAITYPLLPLRRVVASSPFPVALSPALSARATPDRVLPS
jgi:hypothetical protein